MKLQKGLLLSAGLAIIGDLSLLLMKNMYDQQITAQGFGLVVVSYGFGFYLTLLFLALAAAFSFFEYRLLREQPPGYVSFPSVSPAS